MESIYFWCLVIGLILLVVNLISSGITDLFSVGLLPDLSGDGLSGIFPFSLLEVITFVVGFGGTGLTFIFITSWHLVIAITLGLLLAVIVHFLLRGLKKVESNALTAEDLIGMEGVVIVTIFKDSVGSVSFETKTGKITYSAKSDRTIVQGSKVRVIAVEKYTMIVTDELENLI